MFTGLIECIGTVSSVERRGTLLVIAIKPDIADFRVPEGGSVSIDGACLTVERDTGSELYFSAVLETLSRTTFSSITTGRRVNMERALQLGGRLDGHIVLGHVDGVASIVSDRDVRGGIQRTIRVPSDLTKYIAEKGSVSIDGVSLTIAKVQGDQIVISFIPSTLQKTNMLLKKCGDLVNVECDVLARYIGAFLCNKNENENQTLMEKMERLGF